MFGSQDIVQENIASGRKQECQVKRNKNNKNVIKFKQFMILILTFKIFIRFKNKINVVMFV